jgi:hypothetical protein
MACYFSISKRKIRAGIFGNKIISTEANRRRFDNRLFSGIE